MRVSTLHIKNLKGFVDTGRIGLSPTINILVGPNNAGKSTIIKALYLLQPQDRNYPLNYLQKNKRKGTNTISIEIGFDDFDRKYIHAHEQVFTDPHLWKRQVNFIIPSKGEYKAIIPSSKNDSELNVNPILSTEPNNFIYPYFSRRKAVNFNEQIRAENALAVKENLHDLYTKIDRISNPDYPAYQEYKKACKEILGFPVSCSLSANGKQAGIVVSNNEHIALDEMGEGTINILGLLVDICISDDKLFLIEELENDIHPKALKSLLELIIKKSENNQFVISTHSNIITKYLGSTPECKLFQFGMKIKDKMPLTTIKEVNNTPTVRIKVLEDLGYDLYDFELWKAYLILEESSAERVIRDYLIPTFVPTLENKLKTVAAQGVDDIGPRFHDFLRLFVFIHLSSVYKNKAWVYADGDSVGQKTTRELRQKFKTWKPDHFQNFSKPNFENYYPKKWQTRANKALKIQNKKGRFQAKGQLVNDIIDWAKSNKREAKREFKESAMEIIKTLHTLDKKIK